MFKLLTLLLTALLTGGPPAIAAPPPETAMPSPSTAASELTALYRSFNRAMAAADTEALDALLTPDFTLTHMTGYRQPRAEWLEHIRSGQMHYRQIDEVSVQTEANGDHGRIIGRAWNRAHIWGMEGRWPLQLDISLIRENGRWRIARAVASTF